jgi:hypothetical protein
MRFIRRRACGCVLLAIAILGGLGLAAWLWLNYYV